MTSGNDITISLPLDSNPSLAGSRRDGLPDDHPVLGRLARMHRMLIHVPPRQVAARMRLVGLRQLYRIAPERVLPRASALEPSRPAPIAVPAGVADIARAVLEPAGLRRRIEQLTAGVFDFVGQRRASAMADVWAGPHPTPLWAFNLHYLAPVLELSAGGREDLAARMLASWRGAHDHRWDPVAWHPYPSSMRLGNVVLAASLAGGIPLGPGLQGWVARHARYLAGHLEYDLRGNHLLENARALLLASAVVDAPQAPAWAALARTILQVEVPEQILPDGAHFELSPMYHAIVLQRLLEMAAVLGDEDPLTRDVLAPAIARAARFLDAILCPDDDIPLLGDSARDGAPRARVLLDLARAYTTPTPRRAAPTLETFPDSGIHVWRSSTVWAILDAGPVCPPYLPGHGQADSLTVEVWVRGVCVVTDPGTHEYTGPERAWNRSSRAHSTVTLDDQDTSEVWASFRLGGRARMSDVAVDGLAVSATMVPWNASARCRRTVRFADEHGGALDIRDDVAVPGVRRARSRLHLDPRVRLIDGLRADGRVAVVETDRGRVRITAHHPMRLEPARCSRRLGLVEPTTILVQDLRPSRGDHVDGAFRIEPIA
jgi:Heparinase II/III-like protein/Heparinase II/III N-terminus